MSTDLQLPPIKYKSSPVAFTSLYKNIDLPIIVTLTCGLILCSFQIKLHDPWATIHQVVYAARFLAFHNFEFNYMLIPGKHDIREPLIEDCLKTLETMQFVRYERGRWRLTESGRRQAVRCWLPLERIKQSNVYR